MLSKFWEYFNIFSTNENGSEKELALKVEQKARTLSGLSMRPENAPSDIKSILETSCLLLDRLVEEKDREKENNIIASKPVVKAAISNPPNPIKEAVVEQPPIMVISEQKLEPSVIAKELIKLRDWVLLASTSESTASAESFQRIYKKLGQILVKDGVTLLENVGAYDYEKQQVIDTQITDDPSKNDQIYNTVRPGYIFNGKLIRPQEVIVYTFQETND